MDYQSSYEMLLLQYRQLQDELRELRAKNQDIINEYQQTLYAYDNLVEGIRKSFALNKELTHES